MIILVTPLNLSFPTCEMGWGVLNDLKVMISNSDIHDCGGGGGGEERDGFLLPGSKFS